MFTKHFTHGEDGIVHEETHHSTLLKEKRMVHDALAPEILENDRHQEKRTGKHQNTPQNIENTFFRIASDIFQKCVSAIGGWVIPPILGHRGCGVLGYRGAGEPYVMSFARFSKK